MTENALTHAFSDPDNPDSDRQVQWPNRVGGTRGVLPPKFRMEIVYYDQDETVDLDRDPSEYQLEVSLPVEQRPLGDEDPSELRRRIENAMRSR